MNTEFYKLPVGSQIGVHHQIWLKIPPIPGDGDPCEDCGLCEANVRCIAADGALTYSAHICPGESVHNYGQIGKVTIQHSRPNFHAGILFRDPQPPQWIRDTIEYAVYCFDFLMQGKFRIGHTLTAPEFADLITQHHCISNPKTKAVVEILRCV